MIKQPQASPKRANYLDGETLRDGLRDVFVRERPQVERLVASWTAGELDHLYLVGCGGSLSIMEPVKWLLDRYTRLPVDRYTGWEFVARRPARLGPRSAVVLASHSGATEEVLAGLELARAYGAQTVGLSRQGTLLPDMADVGMTYTSPAVNLSKLLLVYMISAELMVGVGDEAAGRQLWGLLETLPEAMHEAKAVTAERSRELAAGHRDLAKYYVVGGGLVAGLAYQFALCSLMEMQWLDAAAINSGEFRHGPLEIVSAGLPMIFLLGQDEMRPVTERALAFSRRYGAETLVFDLADMPMIHPWLAPFGLYLPLQWYLWYLGIERAHPISLRRYMGVVEY